LESNVVFSVIIRQGKAYVETYARTNEGVYMAMDPIYTVSLSVTELTEALEKVYKSGNKLIPHPSQEELRHRPDPVLKAAKVKSWKKLAQGSATYGIAWGLDGVLLEMSKLDKNWRVVQTSATTRKFDSNVSFEEIAQTILNDVRSRPDVPV